MNGWTVPLAGFAHIGWAADNASMPKATPKPSPRLKKPGKAAKASPPRDPRGVAERRRIGATFDVAAFDAAAERTAEATAAEWSKPA